MVSADPRVGDLGTLLACQESETCIYLYSCISCLLKWWPGNVQDQLKIHQHLGLP